MCQNTSGCIPWECPKIQNYYLLLPRTVAGISWKSYTFFFSWILEVHCSFLDFLFTGPLIFNSTAQVLGAILGTSDMFPEVLLSFSIVLNIVSDEFSQLVLFCLNGMAPLFIVIVQSPFGQNFQITSFSQFSFRFSFISCIFLTLLFFSSSLLNYLSLEFWNGAQ